MRTHAALGRISFSSWDPGAPVTIHEYSDFQCPICARFARQYLPQLEEKQIRTGNIRLVYRNFTAKGEKSTFAEEATHSAARQGGLRVCHCTLLVEHGRGVDFMDVNLVRFARELDLKEESSGSCLETREYREKVRAEEHEGEQQNITAARSFVGNGKFVVRANYLVILDAI